MTRSVRVELILDTLRGVRGAKDLSKAVGETADSLGDTAREGDKAARAVDHAGDEMSQAARAAAGLDREIDKLNRSLGEMAIAQALTGDNFSKQIRSQETEVRRLTKNRKLIDVPKIGDFGKAGAEAATEFSTSLSSRLGPVLTKLPVSGPMAAVLGGAAALAAPFIGATIAGAVIGGAGIGGVVGGLIVASKDERVQSATEALAGRLEQRLQQAAGVFVQPALAGLNEIERGINSINIDQIFRDAAQFVQPLAHGASSAIADIGAAIQKLVASAGPVIDVIGRGIASIGEHLSAGLASLSDNGDEAARALSTLFALINAGIDATFILVNNLTELYGIFHKLGLDTNLQFLMKVLGISIGETGDSATSTGEATAGMGEQMRIAADKSKALAEQQASLKVYTDAVKTAQDGLAQSLASLGGATSQQGQRATALRTAMDNLYGAAIRNTDANEAYQASVDSLSDSVSSNGRSLSVNTAAGRANRDALEGLLTSSGELYLSNIAAGVSTDTATRKHRDRIAAVKEEARRLNLNKTETQKLIDTYGKIPPTATTELVLDGLRSVAKALTDLYIFQRSLATGRSIESVETTIRKGNDNGPAKRFGGYATGGWTGPGSMYEPAGVVHADEFVIRKESRRKIERRNPGLLEEMNATGQLPGYAGGGLVAPVETSRQWPLSTDVTVTRIPSRAEVASKVPFAFGNWPSSPAAQRGDSGVWRRIVALINSTGPMSGHFGNAYRAGDPKWHGSGRAVDWMGFNQDRLAGFLAARRPLELIHRTNTRDYAYTRGVNKGSFNESLMNAHRNHVHIAMANGGTIREPVFGYGLRTGASYSLGERGNEHVLTERQYARSGGGGGTTYVLQATFSGPVGSQQQLDNWLTSSFARLKSRNRV